MKEGLEVAPLTRGAVQVTWAAPLSEATAISAALEILDPREAQRAGRFVRPEDRLRFITGRVLARCLLAAHTGRSPSEIAFVTSAAGKPRLSAPGPEFNISHSGALIGVAVCTEPVGIDVEHLDRARDISGLIPNICTPLEGARCAEAPDPVSTFFEIWTAKEAVLKAHGAGFQIGPEHLTVPPASTTFQAVGVGAGGADLADLHVASLAVPSEYRAAVSVRYADPVLSAVTLDADAIVLAASRQQRRSAGTA